MSSNRFQSQTSVSVEHMLLLNFFNDTSRQIDRLIERQNWITEMLMSNTRTPPNPLQNRPLSEPVPRYRAPRYNFFSETNTEPLQEQLHPPSHNISPEATQSRGPTTIQTAGRMSHNNNSTILDNFVLYSFNTDRLDALFEESFNNIHIRPTHQQIQSATTTCLYGGLSDPKNTSCPITLNVFHDYDTVTRINECGHLYDPAALAEWFLHNVQCPLCRYDIRHQPDDNTTVL